MLDWQRLGLESPTHELAVIKRAYAKKLRVTRPDDDAQSYQALREAYDRLVQFARWHAQEAAPADEDLQAPAPPPEDPAPAPPLPDAVLAAIDLLPRSVPEFEPPPVRPPAPVAAPPPAPAPAQPQAPASPPPPSPQALCEALVQQLQRGHAAVQAWLPTLQQQLDALPLQQRAEASARFADLVLQSNGLPLELLLLLEDHFGWLDDFRTARVLGLARAEALQQALDDLPRPITDPITLHRYAETRVVGKLLEQGRKLRALLAIALMGHFLQWQLGTASVALLRRLGLEPYLQNRLLESMKKAHWLHVVMVAALIFCVGLVLTPNAELAASGTVKAGFVGLGGAFLMLAVIGMLVWVRREVHLPPRWAQGLRLHRLTPWWSAIGVVSLLLVALALKLGVWWDWPGLILVSWPAAVIAAAWAVPEAGDQALVAGALTAYGVAALELREPWAVLLVAAWVCAGMHLYLKRLLRPGGTQEPAALGWPRGGLPAALGLATVGLPTLVAWVTEAAGMRLVIGALLLAYSPVYMERTPPLWLLLPTGVLLALGLMLLLQRGALQLARRWWLGRSSGWLGRP